MGCNWFRADGGRRYTLMKKLTELSASEMARIAYHMQLFGLDPATQFKGELVVPEGKPAVLEHKMQTNGVHALVSPKSIAHAKAALGIPNGAYAGTRPYGRFNSLRMVSPEKARSALTAADITELHQAARGYIFGDSAHFEHFKSAIDKHMISNLVASVFVYTQLDLHSDLKLVGNGNPVVLIVHTLNVYPGGSISTDGSPLCLNVTEFNSIKTSNALAATEYDVVINLGTGTKGADGADGAAGSDQPKAKNGKNGSTACCSSGTSPEPGEGGVAGGNGIAGISGMAGGSIAEAVFFVRSLNCNVHVVANGGAGGNGGNAGKGGKGGDGGNGGTGNGTAAGGAGGAGGNGGAGGEGGAGGNGGVICLYVEDMVTKIFDGEFHAGAGGHGGVGGQFGAAGVGGTGNPAGANGAAGISGASGKSGTTGAEGQVIVRKAAIPTVDGFTPNSGPAAGGTVVSIFGTNFYSDSSGAPIMEFRINNKPMTNVSIVSTVQATATAPASEPNSAFPIVVINKETMASGASAQNFVYTT